MPGTPEVVPVNAHVSGRFNRALHIRTDKGIIAAATDSDAAISGTDADVLAQGQ